MRHRGGEDRPPGPNKRNGCFTVEKKKDFQKIVLLLEKDSGWGWG